jgi:hypothetical protein
MWSRNTSVIKWQHYFVNNIIHGSMVILLRENHSKLLILHFSLLREFCGMLDMISVIIKSVEDINIWSIGWWHGHIVDDDMTYSGWWCEIITCDTNQSMGRSEFHLYCCIWYAAQSHHIHYDHPKDINFNFLFLY